MSYQLHFAHANGFPSGSYRKLFSALPDNYHVHAIEKFGHSSRFPISNNWDKQALELNHYLDERLPQEQQVIAVGHSFGAVVSYLAACTRPERFKGLIMLDPPLVSGFGRHVIALAKYTPFIDKLTPASLAKTRNRRWQHSVDLVDYFANKGLFKHMDRDCIQDYVNAVIDESGPEKVVTFDPAVEAELFRTVPHNLHRFAGKLECPATIVTGEQTNVCVPLLRNRFIKQNGLKHVTFPGGHMFPLEQPIEMAAFLVDLIDEMLGHSER